MNWENVEIERARPTKLFEGVGEEEWRTLGAAEMFKVSEALAKLEPSFGAAGKDSTRQT